MEEGDGGVAVDTGTQVCSAAMHFYCLVPPERHSAGTALSKIPERMFSGLVAAWVKWEGFFVYGRNSMCPWQVWAMQLKSHMFEQTAG